jgi:hypothetical protein
MSHIRGDMYAIFYVYCTYVYKLCQLCVKGYLMGRRGRDRMVVGCTTICAI